MSYPDTNRLELVNTADGSQVTIVLQGAHVTSWRTRDGEEHLYTSPKSVYKPGKAIRGGVPLIFPQFSDLGPLAASHGFLRVSHGWRLVGCEPNAQGGRCVATLVYDMAGTPQDTGFETARASLTYTVAFSATELELSLAVRNTHDSAPLTFGCAYHSYFAVHDIDAVRVAGLDETAWLDNLQDRQPRAAEPIHEIHEEVDRIYLGQGDRPVTVTTATAAGAPKTLTIVGRELSDAVLWNPWIAKTKSMTDMPEDDYRKFVCVESGRIVDKVTVGAGATWTGTQHITIS